MVGGERRGAVAVAADCEHCPGLASASRVIHDAAAGDNDAQPVGVVDRPSGGQRADLAERVAGKVLSPRPAELLIAGDRGAVDGRLGVRGAVGNPLEGILADQLGREVEQVGPDGGDELPARRVADALSWKQDR
jgi:hypothetical protein